jgi:1-phosphatidylinositol-3-phosphate 5-kinase
MDDWIWEPPEPDDPEDDVEGSVAFNDDDDDECGDGMKWGKPISLSHSKDEGSGIYKFKEEKQRAMETVINGKFKALVSRLLISVGVVGSFEEDAESWVDIITSLSWEAASFLKPDAVVGKAMDPDGYVKVKCIATGARSQRW